MPDIDSNLICKLSFDEDKIVSGVNNDESGNLNHGTLNAGPTGTTGRLKQALTFDGSSQYVQVAETASLPLYGNTNFTWAMWVKGAVQADKRFFGEASSAANPPLVAFGTEVTGASGVVRVLIRDDGNTNLVSTNSTGIAFDNTWHHLAWTDANGTAKLYIDGVLDATSFTYTRGTISANRTSVGSLLRASPLSFFAGSIDDVRLYTRALAAEDVMAIFMLPRPNLIRKSASRPRMFAPGIAR